MALGHSLMDATQLAINDRARNTGKFQMSHAQSNIPNKYSDHITPPHHPHHIPSHPTTSLFQPSYSYDVRSEFHAIGFQLRQHLMTFSQQMFLSALHYTLHIPYYFCIESQG